MSKIKTEQILSSLKKAYCSGVFGNIDLCDSICMEILNDMLNSFLQSSNKQEEIELDLALKNSCTTMSIAGEYQNFINFDAWTNVIVPNGTTI